MTDPGTGRPDWDAVWLGVSGLLAARSLCDGGAGAVAVAADNRVAFPGYAGPPSAEQTAGVRSCTQFCERHRKPVADRDPGYQDCQSIHAEQNALIHADRTLIAGGSFYVSRPPCWTCEKMIRNSGVRRYVFPVTDGGITYRREILTGRGVISYTSQNEPRKLLRPGDAPPAAADRAVPDVHPAPGKPDAPAARQAPRPDRRGAA
jgi:dCMP deaminase